ncbi:unnamed protein product, partial [Rotaria sordida]
IEKTYQHVNDLRLTIYNNEQMEFELDKPSRFFSNIDTLTIRFEENVSPTLFGKYIKKTINLKYIKHLTLHDEFHNMATLHILIS